MSMLDTSLAKRKFSVIRGSHVDENDRAVTPITRSIRSQEIMRHQPFWTALAAEGLDKQRRRMLQAGLLVLRYLDVYFEEGRDGAHAAMNMRAFRRQLLVCGDTHIGRVLHTIMAMTERPKLTPNVVFGSVAAYAKLLEEFRDFALAYDVWDTVIHGMGRVGVLDKQGYQDLIVLAFQRRAHTSYRLGRPHEAFADYSRAFECAEKYGLERSMAWVSIGTCVVHGALGAHDVALQTLTVQMDKAQQRGWDDIYASAAMSRGYVYSLKQSYQDALMDFSLAVNSQAALREYDTLVQNIAACAAECGYFALARDAHELTCVSASTTESKMNAIINLVELATWTNEQEDFQRFSEWAGQLSGDAKALAYLSLYTARGRIFFGLTDEPIAELTRALETASALNFQPVVAQIQQDIRRFNMGGSLLPPAPKTVPLPLAMRLLHRYLRDRLKEAVA
jgi:hypothetical protein